MISATRNRSTPLMATNTTRPALRGLFWTLLRKELLLGWRQRARTSAMVFFGLVVLLMFSFAVGPQHTLLVRHGPGFFWLALYFASVLQLGASLHTEMENESLEGLRLLAVPPALLFVAKALLNALVLCTLGMVLLPVALALYGIELKGSVWSFVAVLGLGSGAIAAPGTLYSAITAQARAKDVLLPLLLLPLLVPSLMAAVKATSMVFLGDPMEQWASWTWLLVASNGIYWSLGVLLFARVLED